MTKPFKKDHAPVGEVAGEVPFRQATTSGLPPWSGRDWLWALVLISAVFAVYQPVWYAGFVWDDNYHLTANPCIVGPLGLKEIWTTSAASICPLVLTTFWFEHAVWGLAPLPYHLVNVLMHGISAILLWQVLRKLQVPGAWLGAALWALHPVQVESVAWIAEMKNTQSCVFFLLAILFFLRGLQEKESGGSSRDHWNYGLMLVFAALAMASKFSLVILPAVLWLGAWWVEGRWNWRHGARLAPVFLLAAIVSVITVWPRPADPGGAIDPLESRTWLSRVATMGDVIWFYLGKLVWPHPLMAIYPRWQIDAENAASYLPLLAAIIVMVFLWYRRKSPWRPCFFVMVYFLIALSPFLGLLDQSFWHYSFVEDHLQYLASMGPLALAGAGMARFSDSVLPNKLWLQSALCAGLLTLLGIVSWQRAWVFQNQETLWTDSLAKNPKAVVGYSNLGGFYLQSGRLDAAIANYRKALENSPNDAQAHLNLGAAFLEKGQMDAAIDEDQKALKIKPDFASGHGNLGNALLQEGRVDEAIVEYQKAVSLNPGSADPHINLGNAFLQKRNNDGAMAQFQKAIDLNPNNAAAYYNLGLSFYQKGQVDQAVGQFQKALKIKPDYAQAYYSMGTILMHKLKLKEAIALYQKAVAIDPNYVEAHNNLGIAFSHEGDMNQAVAQFEKVALLRPQDLQARRNLAIARQMQQQSPGVGNAPRQGPPQK